MSEPLTVTGIVLAAAPSGEYDKRLVLLTRERGRITAFARGVRRTGSPMMAAANPFVFGQFVVYEGRTAYTLAQAQVTHYFTELASEFPGVYYGFYLLEFADYYGREEKPEKDMLNLLYLSCKALTNPRLDNRLIRCIFELRAMVINGEYPNVFSCAVCGSEEGLVSYSAPRGGLVCKSCRTAMLGEEAGMEVCGALVYTMQFAASCEMKKLFTFTVKDEVLREFEMVMGRHVERYTDRKFKSLEVLETMLG
ncbi:MAG: DNA repair protein RecO [Lachnospiraceae bacterium]|nr:DNA repair protein RecO [Lachnospiraceae bacterium]